MKLLLHDLYFSTLHTLQVTLKQSKRNMSMMFYAAPYVLALILFMVIAPYLGFLSGILLQLLVAAIVADYMDYIRQIVLYDLNDSRPHKRNFRTFFRTAFILFMLIWFIQYAFSLFVAPLLGFIAPFLLIFPFSWLLYIAVIMTPFLECIIVGREEINSAFSEVSHFMKKNSVVWVINAIIAIGIAALIGWAAELFVGLLPISGQVAIIAQLLVFGMVYQFVLGFVMLYRSNLYDLLSKQSRQARVMRFLNKLQ